MPSRRFSEKGKKYILAVDFAEVARRYLATTTARAPVGTGQHVARPSRLRQGVFYYSKIRGLLPAHKSRAPTCSAPRRCYKRSAGRRVCEGPATALGDAKTAACSAGPLIKSLDQFTLSAGPFSQARIRSSSRWAITTCSRDNRAGRAQRVVWSESSAAAARWYVRARRGRRQHCITPYNVLYCRSP